MTDIRGSIPVYSFKLSRFNALNSGIIAKLTDRKWQYYKDFYICDDAVSYNSVFEVYNPDMIPDVKEIMTEFLI